MYQIDLTWKSLSFAKNGRIRSTALYFVQRELVLSGYQDSFGKLPVKCNILHCIKWEMLFS